MMNSPKKEGEHVLLLLLLLLWQKRDWDAEISIRKATKKERHQEPSLVWAYLSSDIFSSILQLHYLPIESSF
jgi:hypothetical protein